MATPFSDIYNSFLNKVTDVDLVEMESEDQELFLYGLMIQSCAKFNDICLIDLTDINNTSDQFNSTLTGEIINIISTGMIVEWLKPQYYFNDNLKNSLNTKDYSTFSPANLLKEIRETYFTTKKEFEGMINNYSYINGNLEDLKPY